MAITAYVGLPGSGKSYSAVAFAIVPALKQGRPVVTNMPLVMDEILLDWPDADITHIDIENYKDGAGCLLDEDVKGGALVVLDELWRLWPSGLKTANVPQDHKSFLAEHRHRVGENGLSTDIIFVTQDLSQIAAFARALVDKTYITQKMDSLGAKGHAKVNLYQGAVTGSRGPQNQHIRTSKVKYIAEYFRFYRSHTKSETALAGEERGADGRAVVWKSPTWIAAAIFVFVGVPWAIVKAAGVLSGSGEEGKTNASEVAQIAQPVIVSQSPAYRVEPTPTPVPTPEPEEVLSISERVSGSGFRLVGYALKQDGTGLALIRNAVGYQTLELESCETISGTIDLACEYGGAVVTFTTGTRYGHAKTYTRN